LPGNEVPLDTNDIQLIFVLQAILVRKWRQTELQ